METVTLFVVVDGDEARRIQAVCRSADEAERVRSELAQTAASKEICTMGQTIHAMNAVFTGDRFRLVYGTPQQVPSHPLRVPTFFSSKITNTDAHSEAFLYPDELFVSRDEALAAAAKHNIEQLKRPCQESLDWAVVVEIGEPLWRRYRSECMVKSGIGWEDTDRVRPVRVVYPTDDEVAGGG